MSARSTKRMRKQTYSFTLVLNGVADLEASIVDALFEAGCDDALFAIRAGVAYLEFDRRASSLEAAVLSAIRDVEISKHPAGVSHVEPGDLVNASEIARRLECTREYVRLLVNGQRGAGSFPSPIGGVTTTSFLWSWTAVLEWLQEQGSLEDEISLENARTIRDFNAALRDRLYPTSIANRKTLLRKLQSA